MAGGHILERRRKIQDAILKVCSSPVPLTGSQIIQKITKEGFFKLKNPSKAVFQLRRNYLAELIASGKLIEFKQGRKGWEEAREIVRIFSKTKPRRVASLYQTHFLYAFPDSTFLPEKLPQIDPEANLGIMALMQSLLKRSRDRHNNIGLDLLNLLLASKEPKTRDRLRLFFYKLHIDYQHIEALENILEYGQALPPLPFKPNEERAKEFVEELLGLK